MSCNEFQERLAALVHGALPPEDAQRVKAHLDTCPSCREEHRSILEMDELLPHWEVDPEPSLRPASELAKDLLARSTADPAHTQGVRWWVAAGLAGAAAGFVFAMLVSVGTSNPEPPAAPAEDLFSDFHPLPLNDRIIDGLSTKEGS